jgi:hypothetical protein
VGAVSRAARDRAISMQRLGEQLGGVARTAPASAEWFYTTTRSRSCTSADQQSRALPDVIATQERDPRTLCCARAREKC